MGDVVLLDEKKDVGARNHRQLAALYCDSKSDFAVRYKIPGVPSDSSYEEIFLLK